jgi:hypothetical protein
VKTALAAGYIQITQDLPGIAAHFMQPAYNTDGDLMNPMRPEFLLYSKRVDGTWRLVGGVWTMPGASGVFAHDFPPISPGAYPGAIVSAAAEVRVQAR